MVPRVFRRLIAAFLVALGLPGPALGVDWEAVSGRDVPLFYPGQTGMEWMLDKMTHDGAARFKKRGKPCRECHEGEETEFGPRIASGQYWEAEPIRGRRGFVTANFKAATEGDSLHIRLSWPNEKSGASKRLDPDYQAKVTVMLGDDTLPEYVQGGCWAVCHQDAKGMPSATGEGELKYLKGSRVKIEKRVGGGKNYRPDAEIAALMKSGSFLEYWQARLNAGAPPKPVSGTILKERKEHDNTGLKATATMEGDNWVVVLSRTLSGGGDKKSFSAGKSYTFGLGIHDQHTSGRYHLVSFEYQLSLKPDGTVSIL